MVLISNYGVLNFLWKKLTVRTTATTCTATTTARTTASHQHDGKVNVILIRAININIIMGYFFDKKAGRNTSYNKCSSLKYRWGKMRPLTFLTPSFFEQHPPTTSQIYIPTVEVRVDEDAQKNFQANFFLQCFHRIFFSTTLCRTILFWSTLLWNG